MTWPFAIIAVLTCASAAAAMSLRNLVHCALCLTMTFAGLAALYLQLGAQFIGFAQILIYIGAVAILIVFAILLTRGGEEPSRTPIVSSSWWVGIAIAVAAFASLAAAVASSVVVKQSAITEPAVTVKRIGAKLMNEYVLPLEVIGLLLTVALIGGVVIAMQERRK